MSGLLSCVQMFCDRFVSQIDAAQYLGVNKSYLAHVLNGKIKNPSDWILDKMGIQKVVTYRLVGNRRLPPPVTPHQRHIARKKRYSDNSKAGHAARRHAIYTTKETRHESG